MRPSLRITPGPDSLFQSSDSLFQSSPVAPLDMPRSQEIIAERYRVGRLIGSGGMAVVLAATHVALEMRVAIKILHPDCRTYPDLVERFLQEARVGARLRSEHVARVYDVGSGAYGPFLVMEHLEGRDLETVVREDGPLRVEQAVDCILDACEALAEAHAAGVVHRDLKPSNLFLASRPDRAPTVKLLDFGISKILSGTPRHPNFGATGPGLLVGSPPYMSPEQVTAPGEVDPRTDIWALGATLYELLVGEPPFGLVTSHTKLMEAIRARHVSLAEVRSDVPPGLDAIVSKCLSFDVRDRYQSVADLAADVAAHGGSNARISASRTARMSGVSGWEVPAPRETPPRAMEVLEGPRARQRRWAGYALAGALVGMTLTGIAMGVDAVTLAHGRGAVDYVPPAAEQPAVSALLIPDPGVTRAAAERGDAILLSDAGVELAESVTPTTHRSRGSKDRAKDSGPES